MSVSEVLGVDGCPGGWIGALVDRDGGVEWRLFPDARAILAVDSRATGIDIPIGLPTVGPRSCDVAARRLLGPRRSSVFPAPVRTVLGAATYGDACALSRAACGRALARQTWNLVPRIADVDAVINPRLQSRVVEVHPEVSFARLAGAVLPSKRTAAGRSARLRALAGWIADPEAALRGAPRPARPDDALDALVAAWSARRWHKGEAEMLPADDTPRDTRGLRMEIVF
ncbi:MAG: DUF429 domain-containing protein [Streptosporangiales bacterium]|nr:DUF429 domain-containing protein [Streptosporangiales bacterium]